MSYYYAHARKNVEGTEHSKVSGGDPILISSKETASKQDLTKRVIKRYSWNDEGAKAKIYIDLAEYPSVKETDVSVKFDEYLCEVSLTVESELH